MFQLSLSFLSSSAGLPSTPSASCLSLSLSLETGPRHFSLFNTFSSSSQVICHYVCVLCFYFIIGLKKTGHAKWVVANRWIWPRDELSSVVCMTTQWSRLMVCVTKELARVVSATNRATQSTFFSTIKEAVNQLILLPSKKVCRILSSSLTQILTVLASGWKNNNEGCF